MRPAGPGWRGGERLNAARGPDPGAFEPDRRRPHAAPAGERAPAPFEDLVPTRTASPVPACPRSMPSDSMLRCCSELRPPVETAAASDRDAQRANAQAYNRFVADVCGDGEDRLFGVAHVVLHDPAWAVEEVRRVRAQGLRLAMIAQLRWTESPSSTPDFDPVWAASVMKASHRSFTSRTSRARCAPRLANRGARGGEQLFDSIFLYLAPAVALANLISPALWSGSGSSNRSSRVDGQLGAAIPAAHRRCVGLLCPAPLGSPSTSCPIARPITFLRQVRVAALPYEMPNRLVPKVGDDTYMLGK